MAFKTHLLRIVFVTSLNSRQANLPPGLKTLYASDKACKHSQNQNKTATELNAVCSIRFYVNENTP